MNKESKTILKYIRTNLDWLSRVMKLRGQYLNQKDFTYQLGYVIMDLVSREPEFIRMDRNKIDINAIGQELF